MLLGDEKPSEVCLASDDFRPEPCEERNAPFSEPLFELLRAIALATGPRLLTIQIAAIFACVGRARRYPERFKE